MKRWVVLAVVASICAAAAVAFAVPRSHLASARAVTELDGTMTIIGFQAGQTATTIPFSDHEWSVKLAGSVGGGGGGAGKVVFQDIHISRQIDQSSPLFMTAVANGKHYSQVALSLFDGATLVSKYTLSGVFISSLHESPDGFNSVEELTLNFSKIAWEYGPTKACWDIKANKKC
jgi:type VI secretion system secreted protein Hcp